MLLMMKKILKTKFQIKDSIYIFFVYVCLVVSIFHTLYMNGVGDFFMFVYMSILNILL